MRLNSSRASASCDNGGCCNCLGCALLAAAGGGGPSLLPAVARLVLEVDVVVDDDDVEVVVDVADPAVAPLVAD